MPPVVVHTIADVRRAVRSARVERILAEPPNLNEAPAQIALVPTMGALHAGHLSLVAECRRRYPNALIVVSIFVNPLQFAADGADLHKYPRTLDADVALLGDSADLVFAPAVDEIYPEGGDVGAEIRVILRSGSAAKYEGAKREGHFDGVLTVVSKLFNIVQPDVAAFGQKDAEQAFLIGRLIRQLDFPIRMLTLPTVREADGLAMSSRNRHLNPSERQSALQLSKALFAAQKRSTTVGEALEAAHRELQDAKPRFQLDYLAAVDAETMEPADPKKFRGNALILVAAIVGETRLIDNVVVEIVGAKAGE